MSTNLYWAPVPKDKQYLDCALKFALRKKYGTQVDAIFSYSDMDYLCGLRDAGVEGAQELMNAITEHGEIHVAEE